MEVSFAKNASLLCHCIIFITNVIVPLNFFKIIIPIELFPNSKEICSEEVGGSIVMCPLCDLKCGYWKLNTTCNSSWVRHPNFVFIHDSCSTPICSN